MSLIVNDCRLRLRNGVGTGRQILGASVLIALACLLGQPAVAHGGEDHADAPPAAATPSTTDKTVTRATSSETFELVVKLDAAAAGQAQHVHLYLADYATNAPVENAKLALDWGDQLTGTVKPTRDAGIYETTITFPKPGTYSPLVSVSAGGHDDLLTLDPITVTAQAPTAAKGNVLILASTIATAGLLAWILLSHRRKRAAQAPLEISR